MRDSVVLLRGRYGDIINSLPIAQALAPAQEGGKMPWAVNPEFADFFDGVSFIDPIVIPGYFGDFYTAKKQLLTQFKKVISAQPYRSDGPGFVQVCDAFNRESWHMAKFGKLFDKLPLVIDRRDHNRELELVEKLGVTHDTLLTSFAGHSSPFPHTATVADAVAKAWPRPILDLSGVRAHRLFDLLGVFDTAAAALLTDSSPLHLAQGSGIPISAFIADRPTLWHGTAPRRQGVRTVRYSEAPYTTGTLLAPHINRAPKIFHVFSWHKMPQDMHDRHRTARLTWSSLYRTGVLQPMPFLDRDMKRSGADIGDKPLPLVGDIFDWACERMGAKDIVLFSNGDICFAERIVGEAKAAVEKFGVFYAKRIDVRDATVRPTTGRKYAGADVFAFSPGWWRRHRSDFPDFYLSKECFDAVLKQMAINSGFRASDEIACWHQLHDGHVYSAEAILKGAAQMSNRNAGYGWFKKHGLTDRLLCRPEKAHPLIKDF